MATLKSRISVGQNVHFQEVDGEAVLLNLESGKYFSLDRVGTRMWQLLAEHGQVESALRLLLQEYDVTEDRLQQDLIALIDRLASHGLVHVADS
jgi:Coenzyme PQQ synthesis protein D (PqqD)